MTLNDDIKMEKSLYYIELSKNPIRFDSVSQLTNVFFDDANKQIFAVRSGGATGVAVRGPTEECRINFRLNDKGAIRSIKLSPDNKLLAVQRTENSVEFLDFNDGQPNLNDTIVYNSKNSVIYGFVWLDLKEITIISNEGIDMFLINISKKQIKSLKSLSMTINWFSWCPSSSFAVLATNNSTVLNPVLLKLKTITKLPKLEFENGKEIPERDVTLAQIYGKLAILILQQNQNRLVEVIIYLLSGPGLAPQKSHILRLGHSGRFAMNVVDNLIAVHHQATATSLLFDIALNGEVDPNGLMCHAPLTPGKTIKPFALKIPSLSLDGQTMECELYSKNWVLFQPNIIIDAELGCMWYLSLHLEPLCSLITDRVRLVEFLLQRDNGKSILLNVLKQLIDDQYNGTLLPIIENIFNKINFVYGTWVSAELQMNTAQSPSVKTSAKIPTPPMVLINQSDMMVNVFQSIAEKPFAEKVLILYLQSLAKNNIVAQEDLSIMIVAELIRNKHFDTLQKLIDFSLILESKPLACYLLSHNKISPYVTQMAMDMLSKMNAKQIILEILLGQGKVIDALRLAKTLPDVDTISSRKYLEAAQNKDDPLIFYAAYMFFQQRNIRLRGSADFLKIEQCTEFVEHFNKLFGENLQT